MILESLQSKSLAMLPVDFILSIYCLKKGFKKSQHVCLHWHCFCSFMPIGFDKFRIETKHLDFITKEGSFCFPLHNTAQLPAVLVLFTDGREK